MEGAEYAEKRPGADHRTIYRSTVVEAYIEVPEVVEVGRSIRFARDLVCVVFHSTVY